MERVPEYCKVGLATSLVTITNGLTYGLLRSYQLSGHADMGCKAFMIAFPLIGLGITTKKMYEYNRGFHSSRAPVPLHID